MRLGIIIQILLGALTLGLLALDNITLGEAVILATLGAIYNRAITIHQDIHEIATKEENQE